MVQEAIPVWTTEVRGEALDRASQQLVEALQGPLLSAAHKLEWLRVPTPPPLRLRGSHQEVMRTLREEDGLRQRATARTLWLHHQESVLRQRIRDHRAVIADLQRQLPAMDDRS